MNHFLFIFGILIMIYSDQLLLVNGEDDEPTSLSTDIPTSLPTDIPTNMPNSQPTSLPTTLPTCSPTVQPSALPSGQPSSAPSEAPICEPTSQPTSVPSSIPTSPTSIPTSMPSADPTNVPTTVPTNVPSGAPIATPTFIPTLKPTGQPTSCPSSQPSTPSSVPSTVPTTLPTGLPTGQPTGNPTGNPTVQPSGEPSSQPSGKPSGQPTRQPTGEPSAQPTSCPSGQPTSQPSGSYVESITLHTSLIFNFPTSDPKSCNSLNATDYSIFMNAIIRVVANGNKQLETVLNVNVTGCNDAFRRKLIGENYKFLDFMSRERHMVTRAAVELDYTMNLFNPKHYGYTDAKAFQEDATTQLDTASDSGTLIQIIQQNPNSNLASASSSIQGNVTSTIQVISTPTPTSAPTISHPPTSAPTSMWDRYKEVNDAIIDGTFGPMSALTDSFTWMIFSLTLGIVLGLSFAHYYVNKMDINRKLINESMKLRKEDRLFEKFQAEIYNSPNAHRMGHDFTKHSLMNTFESPFSLPRLDDGVENELNQSFKLEVSQHLRNISKSGSTSGSTLGKTNYTDNTAGSPHSKLKVRRGGKSRPWWHTHSDDVINIALNSNNNQDQDNISIASSKFASKSKAPRRMIQRRKSGNLGRTGEFGSRSPVSSDSNMNLGQEIINYDDNNNASDDSDSMEYSDIYSEVSDERKMEALSNMKAKKTFQNIQDKQKLFMELANTIQTLRKECGMQPKVSLTGSDVQMLFHLNPKAFLDSDIDKLKVLIKECKDEVNMLITHRSELKTKRYDNYIDADGIQSESPIHQPKQSSYSGKNSSASATKTYFKQRSDGSRSAQSQVNRSMKDRIQESLRRKNEKQLVDDGNDIGDSSSVASSQRGYMPTPPRNSKASTFSGLPPTPARSNPKRNPLSESGKRL